MMQSTSMWKVPLACTAALVAGCYSGTPGSAADEDGDGSGSAADSGDDDDAGDDAPGTHADELPAPSHRVARLTHEQWDNTIADLLYLDASTDLADEFRPDAGVSGYLFDNSAQNLSVDAALWSGYEHAAAEVAEMAASDPAILAAIASETDPESFVRTFGRRAFRRALGEDEVARYVALFDSAAELYGVTPSFEIGVRLVLETMLQSPHFLYRIEQSATVVGDVIALDSDEVASRLSYFLWRSMPDDELFAAADDDMLRDDAEVEAHARRMLAAPRARPVVAYFHDALLDAEKIANADPNPTVYDVPADLGQLALEEQRRFLADIVFERHGSWRDVLTSSQTFVNADLAAIYGLAGTFGSEFVEVELDEQRRGVLTHVGFLTANATSVQPDPIHRGVFIATRLACATLPPPPDDVPPLPPIDPDQTNRQVIEALTEQPGSNCAGCHAAIINPFGFPFESFDAIGGFRTEDNGQPVDASSSVMLGSEIVDVDDAVDLVVALAENTAVHRCYAGHWVQYAFGRLLADEDGTLLDRLATESAEGDISIEDLLVGVVTSQPFLSRATEELP
jgi:hypothetical protein